MLYGMVLLNVLMCCPTMLMEMQKEKEDLEALMARARAEAEQMPYSELKNICMEMFVLGDQRGVALNLIISLDTDSESSY